MAVDGCGSDGIFAAADNNNDWRCTVGSIRPPPPSMTTIVDKDCHRRRRYRPLLQPTMTDIAVVNDDYQSHRLHPIVASIDNNRRQRRPACQRTLGWRHQRRAWPPSDPFHCRLRQRRSLLTKTANTAVNNKDWPRRLHPTAASAKDDRCQQRPPTLPSMTTIGVVGSTHCHLC